LFLFVRIFLPRVDTTPLHSDNLGPNQACTVFGATSGNNIIEGTNYLKVGYDLDVANLWRLNLTVLIGFFIFFQLAQFIALEFYPQYGYTPTVSVFIRESEETKALNQAQRERKQQRDVLKEKGEALEAKERLVLESSDFRTPG
jgi:ATP-binding cassette subfamily G (WHITE) protein 2 (SNQ2)